MGTKGFSLLEVVLGAALLVPLTIFGGRSYLRAVQLNKDLRDRATADGMAAIAVQHIKRVGRIAKQCQVFVINGATSLECMTLENERVRFIHNAPELRLERQVGGTWVLDHSLSNIQNFEACSSEDIVAQTCKLTFKPTFAFIPEVGSPHYFLFRVGTRIKRDEEIRNRPIIESAFFVRNNSLSGGDALSYLNGG